MSDDELSTSLHEKMDLSIGFNNGGSRGPARTQSSSSRGRVPGSPKPSSLLRTSLSPNSRKNGGGGGRGGEGSSGRDEKGGGKGAGGGGRGAGAGGGGADDRSVMSSSGHGKRGGSGGSGGGGGGSGVGGGGGKGQRGESEDWTGSGGGKGGQQQLAHSKMVHLFSHLPQYSKRAAPGAAGGGRHAGPSSSRPELHPAVVTLGLLFSDGSVRGSNARTAAMLLAFKEVVQAYQPTPDRLLRLDLDKTLKPHIQHLIDCRPHSIAMGNAIKWLRGQVHGLKREAQAEEAKRKIMDAIETYITERITFAAETLARCANEKITDGDVILAYGRSYSVELALKMAKEEGKDFRVVVADSRPLLEGRRLLASLSAAGIPTTYVNLNASSYVMRTVSKAFLGAAAMLSNGAVISRAGTAVVAMMARRFNIPAIFCCETYKFSDKVQLDSICWNEIGDPSELTRGANAATGAAAAAAQSPPAPAASKSVVAGAAAAAATTRQPKILNIRYDLTPMKYVSLVITEVGMIPPTSVPVLIREYNKDDVTLPFDF